MSNESSEQTAIAELQARDAIGRLLSLYGQLLDDLRLDEWGQLFTEDAIWRILSVTFRGRQDIVKGVGGMEPDHPGFVKHLTFPPVIDFESDTRARVWADQMALTSHSDGWLVAAAGRYHDVVVLDEGRWRFASREADVRWPPGSHALTDIVPTPGVQDLPYSVATKPRAVISGS
jgi:hypothetical protein